MFLGIFGHFLLGIFSEMLDENCHSLIKLQIYISVAHFCETICYIQTLFLKSQLHYNYQN